MVSCGKDAYVDMKAVDPDCWERSVSIFYENEDTESLHNLSVALRYNNDFEADTLSVVVHTSLPDAHQFREQFMLRSEITALQPLRRRSWCHIEIARCSAREAVIYLQLLRVEPLRA